LRIPGCSGSTQGHGDRHDLTEQVADILTRSPVRVGLEGQTFFLVSSKYLSADDDFSTFTL
jgi:hypothetical protein